MNNVVTISREFGSGGRELGKKLADFLGYAYYDREIISAIAAEKHLNENYVANIVENGGLENYSFSFANTFSIQNILLNQQKIEILTAQEKVIRKLADTQNAIIIGRCADTILEAKKSFNIFIYSDMNSKIKRCREYAKENENLTLKELQEKIKQVNKNRKKYYESYTGKIWGAKENYHLCINTTTLNIDEIIPLIAEYSKSYFKNIIEGENNAS